MLSNISKSWSWEKVVEQIPEVTSCQFSRFVWPSNNEMLPDTAPLGLVHSYMLKIGAMLVPPLCRAQLPRQLGRSGGRGGSWGRGGRGGRQRLAAGHRHGPPAQRGGRVPHSRRDDGTRLERVVVGEAAAVAPEAAVVGSSCSQLLRRRPTAQIWQR